MTKINSIRNPISRYAKVSGTLLVVTITMCLLAFVAGCSEDPCPVADNAPPFPPDGVFSITGDGVVTICWNENWENDLRGYAVYRNDQLEGKYTRIGKVPATELCYDDYDVVNGETWFYAVAAYDNEGNESDLSWEEVFDTPRPEGTGLMLWDNAVNDDFSGYDFSAFTRRASHVNATDIYVTFSGPIPYINTSVSGLVKIQDYGYIDLIDVTWAPENGYADAGRVEAIEGHSYIVLIDGLTGWNVAKIEVTTTTSNSITVDWAYQEVKGSLELAPGGGASK